MGSLFKIIDIGLRRVLCVGVRESRRKPKNRGCVNRIVNQIVNLRIEIFGKSLNFF